jgi:hypothetical protein
MILSLNNKDTRMKTIIRTPGFTAEVAVPAVKHHYQTTDYRIFYTGAIHPAISPAAGLPCLKIKCSGFPFLNCHTTVGHVNPVTGRCE